MPKILFWGRSDPDYSRNRVVRQVLTEMGWDIADFYPRISSFGDVEAAFRRVPAPSLVWVPCFRHRDVSAAYRFCTRNRVPLLFDPLISAYDKQVYEKQKFSPDSRPARSLLKRERQLLQKADIVLADTKAHAVFFHQALGVPEHRIHVVPVGAEEGLFKPQNRVGPSPGDPLEVLFYGSFIPLQGPQVIVKAARCYEGPSVNWRLVGSGPLREKCEREAEGLSNVFFEDWVPYQKLPDLINHADILLGVFGTTPKAERVIPNKFYQAAACGRPIVTMSAKSYPNALLERTDTGISWVPAGDATALAAAVAKLACYPETLPELSAQVRQSYESCFSMAHIRVQLTTVLSQLDAA